MRIICLYNQLHPLTVKAIEAHAPQTEFIDTSGSDFAYWEAIAAHWTGEDDLMLIEHDVEIHAQTVPQFEECENLWCHFSYPYRGGVTVMATGCTRYRAELQRKVSTADILAEPSYRGIPGHWEYMDATIGNAFAKKGIGICTHSPPVGHRGAHRPCQACVVLNDGQCLRGYPSADSCFYNIRAGVGEVLPFTKYLTVFPAPTWRHPVRRVRMLYTARQLRKVPVDAPYRRPR